MTFENDESKEETNISFKKWVTMSTPPLLLILSFWCCQYNFTCGLKYNAWAKSLLCLFYAWTYTTRRDRCADQKSLTEFPETITCRVFIMLLIFWICTLPTNRNDFRIKFSTLNFMPKSYFNRCKCLNQWIRFRIIPLASFASWLKWSSFLCIHLEELSMRSASYRIDYFQWVHGKMEFGPKRVAKMFLPHTS